jgi:hypothetical protein
MIEVMERTGTRKQPLADFKENTGYWKLREESLDNPVWRTRCGRGCGPVVKETMERMGSKTTVRYIYDFFNITCSVVIKKVANDMNFSKV